MHGLETIKRMNDKVSQEYQAEACICSKTEFAVPCECGCRLGVRYFRPIVGPTTYCVRCGKVHP